MVKLTTILGSIFLFIALQYLLIIINARDSSEVPPTLSWAFALSLILAILLFSMNYIVKGCQRSCGGYKGVTTCRLLLILPLLPFIWIYYLFSSSRRGRQSHQPGVIERCCALRRPGARKRHVVEKKKTSEEGFSWYLHSYLACMIQWGCCVLRLTKDISIREAIHRYVEGPKRTWADLLDSIEKNKYLSFLIEYLSQNEPKFYFRILPSGSIREGFGYPLPSTSVLASDYDLMLVPDGIFVYDEFTEREGRFPASFTAVDDPNQNPERPKGFLWLKLENTIEIWKDLCYERMTPDGGTVVIDVWTLFL